MAIFNSNYVLGLALSVVSFPGHTIPPAPASVGESLHTGNRTTIWFIIRAPPCTKKSLYLQSLVTSWGEYALYTMPCWAFNKSKVQGFS